MKRAWVTKNDTANFEWPLCCSCGCFFMQARWTHYHAAGYHTHSAVVVHPTRVNSLKPVSFNTRMNAHDCFNKLHWGVGGDGGRYLFTSASETIHDYTQQTNHHMHIQWNWKVYNTSTHGKLCMLMPDLIDPMVPYTNDYKCPVNVLMLKDIYLLLNY